jgi:oligopeptide/dipeptide ABC transporter ATP-binding protein
MPALTVEGLSVAFPGPTGPVSAVDRVSFTLQPGEAVGLVGESGCGKTATGLALAGLLDSKAARVTAGSVRLADRELVRNGAPPPGDPELAMIFQEPARALDPVFTTGWQISAALRRRRKLGRAAARAAALQALADVGFPEPEEVFAAYPGELSGGMRQLVMIAMAMAVRPRVLIADEPTTALDVTTQALVLQRLLQLRDQLGTALLLITHDLGVVARCCSRILVMYCGQIVEQAPYDAFHAAPRHPYSVGLLAAVPRVAGPRVALRPIPGQVPPAGQLPNGCRFTPRCDSATPVCAAETPELRGQAPSLVACHHPL